MLLSVPRQLLFLTRLDLLSCTGNACLGELLLCALEESINDLGVPSSVNNADAQLRAFCWLAICLCVLV